jgi:hypothetical protein
MFDLSLAQSPLSLSHRLGTVSLSPSLSYSCVAPSCVYVCVRVCAYVQREPRDLSCEESVAEGTPLRQLCQCSKRASESSVKTHALKAKGPFEAEVRSESL